MVEPGEEVHQWLSYEAWRYFNSQIEGAELEQYIGTWGVDGVYADVAQNTVLDGARDEDKGLKPPLMQGTEDGSFDLDSPSLRHFCESAKDIYHGFDMVGTYDSALTQAGNIWNTNPGDNCLGQYAAGNKKAAYYYLGHVAHLLEDMTVPAHTHNDPHGTDMESMHDSYEQDYAATNFQNYHFEDQAGGEYILQGRPITVPGSLYDAFYTAAEYADDYDSNHGDGEYVTSGLAACFFPTDFPSATLHKPDVALRTGGGSSSTITNENCAIIANDLMYWTIERAAQLYRLFYHEVDTAPFHARVYITSGDELSQSEAAPSVSTGTEPIVLKFRYDAGENKAIQPPASGIVKSSRVLHYDFMPEGGEWGGERTVAIGSNADSFSLVTSRGLYKLWLEAESGAGYAAQTDYRYLQAASLKFVVPPIGGDFEYGGTLRMRVQVNDTVNSLDYQWYKDGQPIPDAISDTYEVRGLEMEDAGAYQCSATDSSGTQCMSRPAIVNVYPAGTLPAMSATGLFLAGMCIFLLSVKRIAQEPVR